MAVTMGLHKAVKTAARYLCANCWGPLTYDPLDMSTASVTCRTEDCPCSGFVSKGYVERLEAEAEHEAIKIKRNIRGKVDFLPALEKKTNDEILKELGF